MERPEKEVGGGEGRSDLELAERLLAEAEALAAQIKQTEEGLVRDTADMVEGNQRLDQEVRANPLYKRAYREIESGVMATYQEARAQAQADIEAEQQSIDSLKQRLAALEASQVDNAVLEQIREALVVAETNLQQKIEQSKATTEANWEGVLASQKKHRGFADEFAKTTEDGGVDFAVETVAAAHQMENPQVELDQEGLKGKTKAELKRREDERKIVSALEKDELQLAEYEGLLVGIEQEFADMKEEYKAELDKVRDKMKEASFLKEVEALIKDYRKKDNAKVFKDRAGRERDGIGQQLDEKHHDLTGIIAKAEKRIGEFCGKHSDFHEYRDNPGGIYNIRGYTAYRFEPKPGDISDDLMERLQKFQQKFEDIKVRMKDLAGRIKEYWSPAIKEGNDLMGEVHAIFSFRK